MNIGEKIKALRTAKFMTQSELAGTEITRNMLSRIEHGAAQPSLDTLRYLADKLNVSAGYLISDASDEQIYIKRREIINIKTAYLNEDYRICRDMCLNSASAKDDEIKLILAECTLHVAIEAFSLGNLRQACEYFDLALEECAQTIYNTNHVSAISAMYFRYMRVVSPTLNSNFIDESEVPVYSAMYDPFCKYMAAFIAHEDEQEYEFDTSSGDAYALHMSALSHVRDGRYAQAYEDLHKILVEDTVIPEPMMYFIFRDLEVCCKEIEDYRGAYEYSINKVEILQKLLTQ
jgi:transcriptional regulator with XRE-family HTH domain